MTKTFEEELKDREAETFSHWDGCTISKKEFINYADVVNLSEGWVSPEAHQARVNELIETKEKNVELLRKNSTLKSQLQQQAPPVVPECVAGAIESIPRHYSAYGAISLIKDKIKTFPEGNEDWVPIYKWLFDDINNQDIFAIAFITRKYEVEKPQLFYLKNKLTTSYLALDINTGYYEHWGEEIIPKLLNKQGYKLSFTQQEIDSMETGSYEQIEVAE